MKSLRSHLLVAGPTLLDPNFHRSVVLVCEHSEEGALGLIVNRRTPVEIGDAVPELTAVLGGDARLWSGGPVQPSSIVLLADLDAPPDDALMVLDSIGLVLQGADLAELPLGPRGARAFLGYAGWGPGQLESEVERDDWLIIDAEADDAFAEDPERLWARVLARNGGEYALLATMPPDPSLN
jgi:putative transcriptional regulator